jgi:hypothetical protein
VPQILGDPGIFCTFSGYSAGAPKDQSCGNTNREGGGYNQAQLSANRICASP